MKTNGYVAKWAIGALLLSGAALAAAQNHSFGAPAIPIGDSDIALEARNSAVVVPPSTLIRLMPPNDRPELHITEIAFFVQSTQESHSFLSPNQRFSNYEYRVPDHYFGRLHLEVIGADSSGKQTELQAADVIVDPAAYCHAHVDTYNDTTATLGVTSGITGAYIFVDGVFVGKATGVNGHLSFDIDRLSPGDEDLTVISQDQYGCLYAPCDMPITVKPRFTLSLSKTQVSVTQPTDSVSFTATAPSFLSIAKIRFLFDNKLIGVVNGPAATKSYALGDVGSGTHTFGVQGIATDGDILGQESVNLQVANPVADQRLALLSLQERLQISYGDLRKLDDQLDSVLTGLIQQISSNNTWYGNWGQYDQPYYNSPSYYIGGGGVNLNSFKNRQGLYTIPIIDSYGGWGYFAATMADARNLILQRANVGLTIAQIQIDLKRPEDAKRTLNEVQEEAFGTSVQRRAAAMLRNLS